MKKIISNVGIGAMCLAVALLFWIAQSFAIEREVKKQLADKQQTEWVKAAAEVEVENNDTISVCNDKR